MKVCCVCSEFIVIDGEGDKGSLCPECEVNYCFKCSATDSTCSVCGTVTVSYDPEYDPAFKLKKGPLIKNRKHFREQCVSTIEYIEYNGSHRTDHVTKVKALTKDVSPKGMCIFTEAEHKKGDRIKIIECPTYGKSHDAEVLWFRVADKTINMVGLRFL
jgi:hypothetical protein